MADIDPGADAADAPDAEVEAAEDADAEDVTPEHIAPEPKPDTDTETDTSVAAEAASEPEPDVEAGHELRAMRARKTLEEQAEAARRRVLGSSRGRAGPATLTQAAPDDDVDLNAERVRELVRGVEDEIERLQEDVFRLRSAAGRAGATLHEEIQRAADELSEQQVDDLETAVSQTATESLAALTAAVDGLQETAGALNEVAAGLRTSIEQLGKTAPVAEQLAELAAAPPALPDALAGILRDLTLQLGALSDAVSTQVRASVTEALTTELTRYEARLEHSISRVVDELARLRRRLPVAMKGTPVDFSNEQLTSIGQAVGDYLLAAMREQQT
ncbi:MAG: hypothetical protein JOZ04_06925 [Acidimicrobiia bacterium]|nr:hypothetical protein [Acidimicrobiia bacterium]